jgi:hypothetical protein
MSFLGTNMEAAQVDLSVEGVLSEKGIRGESGRIQQDKSVLAGMLF